MNTTFRIGGLVGLMLAAMAVGAAQDSARPMSMKSRLSFPTGTVIRVALTESLSSLNNHHGDRFKTIAIDNNGVPLDTHIEGVVVGARAQNGLGPGMLELRFDRIDLPDGKSYAISGSLMRLDAQGIQKKGDRMFAMKSAPARMVFMGYGSPGPRILGLATKGDIESMPIDSLLSLRERNMEAVGTPIDVQLNSGETFGVRLTKPMRFQPDDIR